jgi:hypothetical protein
MRQRSKTARARVIAAVIGGALLVLPPVGRAATVSVSQGPNAGQQNEETLAFQAGPGEANDLVLSIGNANGTNIDVIVRDSGAAIVPGPGCGGGGAPGVVATCPMQAPRHPAEEACGHPCLQAVPRTGWTARVRADLGDGDDALDASALHSVGGANFAEIPLPFNLVVRGGEGDDTIRTSAGDDIVEPGPGGRHGSHRPRRRHG